MKKVACFFVLFFMLCFHCASSLWAKNSQEEAYLDLQTFLQLACENDVELERILLQQAQVPYLKALSMPDPSAIFSVSNQYGIGLDDPRKTESWEAGLSKDFPLSGTQVSASHRINKQVDREEKVTSIGIQQSLLKNSFGKQERKRSRSLDLEKQALTLQIVEDFEDYIAVLAGNFLEWKSTHLTYVATQKILEESQKLENLIKARQKQGVAFPFEVYRSSLESLNYQENLERLKLTLLEQSRLISLSIGKEETQNVLPGNISEALSQKSIDREDEEDRIKESRSLQALDLLMQAGHKKVEVRHSDLFPELNAILGFSFDDSTRFSTSADRQQMYVGFNFSMPLGNKKTKAQKQSVQYETMQAELAKIDFERDLRSKIKTLHIEMDNIDRRIKLAESKLNLSRKIVKEEQRRYKNGQISIETLINSIQSELEHELNVVTLSVERSKKSIQWMQVTDRLVVKNNQIDL